MGHVVEELGLGPVGVLCCCKGCSKSLVFLHFRKHHIVDILKTNYEIIAFPAICSREVCLEIFFFSLISTSVGYTVNRLLLDFLLDCFVSNLLGKFFPDVFTDVMVNILLHAYAVVNFFFIRKSCLTSHTDLSVILKFHTGSAVVGNIPYSGVLSGKSADHMVLIFQCIVDGLKLFILCNIQKSGIRHAFPLRICDCLTVNKQIEVSLHLVSPMLVFFILAMPVLLPMLYSGKFLPVLPMMQVAALAMYARAIFLPIEYIALSRGDSKRFLCIELVNDALLLTMAILGYSRYGLLGMGVGMTVASVLEVFVAAGFCRVAYGYKLSVAQLKIISVHASIGVLTSLLTFVDNVWIYVSVGTLLLALDLAYTLSIMRRHVDIDIVNRIKRKFVRRS